MKLQTSVCPMRIKTAARSKDHLTDCMAQRMNGKRLSESVFCSAKITRLIYATIAPKLNSPPILINRLIYSALNGLVFQFSHGKLRVKNYCFFKNAEKNFVSVKRTQELRAKKIIKK